MDTDIEIITTTLTASEAVESRVDPKAAGEGEDGAKWQQDLRDEVIEGKTVQS